MSEEPQREVGVGGTHAQRRQSQRIKQAWLQRLAGGSATIRELVAASTSSEPGANYLETLTLVDILAAVHPGVSRAQLISELQSMPIRLPADPARFTIRTIRGRENLVEIMETLARPSAITKGAAKRAVVPSGWPWGTKLSELVKLNAADVPEPLLWLEEDGHDTDFLLSESLGDEAEPPDEAPSDALPESVLAAFADILPQVG